MSEKMSKQVEAQMSELNARIDEQNRTIQDLQNGKARAQQENSDLNRQLEDAESRISQLNKERQSLMAQLEDAKRSLEDETRVSYSSRIKSMFKKPGRAFIKLVFMLNSTDHEISIANKK